MSVVHVLGEMSGSDTGGASVGRGRGSLAWRDEEADDSHRCLTIADT